MLLLMSLSVRSLARGFLVRPIRQCISVAHMSERAHRPEEIEELKRIFKAENRSLNRKVYEKLGFHPPYIDNSEKFEFYFELEPKERPIEEDPLYQEKPAFVFTDVRRLQEGLNQTLWLTKSILMEDKMPKNVLDTVADMDIPDMEQRVTDSIRESRQFDTREKVIRRHRYIYTQTLSLLRLSNMLGADHILNKMTTENPLVVASWDRDGDHIQVKGEPGGLLISSHDPLPPPAGKDLVEATSGSDLPTFDPLHPTIDLKTSHVYLPHENSSGFAPPHRFPHAHTRIIFNKLNWRQEPSVSQAVMYTFADGFARAKELYGPDFSSDLETPIVVQGIETDGVRFSFITVQINTLDMDPEGGTKNMVWVDQEDNLLYNDMYPQDIKVLNRKGNKRNRFLIRLFIKKRDPEVGCQDLNIGVFQKFLAFLGNH